MTAYRCGCEPPTYCPTHRDERESLIDALQLIEPDKWAAPAQRIHDFDLDRAVKGEFADALLATFRRWRSVTLDARATPTRRRG